MAKPLLIAAGNRWRRDDGIGPAIVDRLATQLGDQVDTLHISGEGAGLIDAWDGYDEVWLFDAAAAAGQPGRTTCIEAHHDPVPAVLCHHSTHRFGVCEAIEMARVLEQLPERLVLIAIEGEYFGEGEGLSEAAASAAGHVANRLVLELGNAPNAL